MTPIPSPIPNPPFANIANVVPPPPQDPPTIDDVIRAKVYAQRALVAELYPDQIDDATIAGALVYQDSILAASSAGAAAPPWFGDAMKQALEPIEKALDDVKQRCRQLNTRLNDIDARFDTVDKSLTEMGDKTDAIAERTLWLMIFTIQNYNRTLGDGRPS